MTRISPARTPWNFSLPQDGEISNVKAEPEGVDLRTGEQTYSFTVTKTKDNSKAKYWAVAPDDFAAAPDTVNIAETTYCCERQRPRVQDLIARALMRPRSALPSYGATTIRPGAGPRHGRGALRAGPGTIPRTILRQVEIRKHCIRVLGTATSWSCGASIPTRGHG
jgi:hypothetical protein